MRHLLIASVMFIAALLATSIAATMVEQWATTNHVVYDPPADVARQQPQLVKGDKPAPADRAPSDFQLGSPYRLKKSSRP